MTKLFSTLFLFSLFIPLNAQISLSGIVNVYATLAVQNECDNSIEVNNATDFNPGMGIIILQTTGASISLSNDGSYGTVNDFNGAGQYEYNRIVDIIGNTLELEYGMINNYDPVHTQVVGFQIHENASVDQLVTAAAYDGLVGGVAVIEVENTLTLNATIDLSGLGFSGGQTASPLNNNCSFLTFANSYFYDSTNWRGAPKGQGIARLLTNETSGRGAPANGGGGGNDHNSGGGGGALLSNGGQGGQNNEPSTFGCDGNFPGLGGRALPMSANQLFMGGGGGSGHTNNLAVSGGNGGGILIIVADNIVANGGQLLSNGTDGQNTNGDGSGGGGAGGMILLLSNTVTGDLVVEASGGAGGSVNNGNADRCFGPGGGGSGGHFWQNVGIAANVSGGGAGLSTNSQACAEGTNGAIAGETGGGEVLLALVQGEPFVAPSLLGISNDSLVCPNEIVNLLAMLSDNADVSLQWQYMDFAGGGWTALTETATTTGTQTAELSVVVTDASEGQFRLLVTPTNSCFAPFTSTSVELTVIGSIGANPSFSINENTVDFVANANTNVDFVEWTFEAGQSSNELNPSYSYPGPGTYPVTFVYTNECGSFSIELEVVISAPLIASIGASSLMGCAPFVVLFEDQSIGEVIERNWVFPGGNPASSTAESPVVTFSEVGVYEVSLTVDNGSNSNSSTISVEALIPPVPSFSVTSEELTISLTNLSSNATSYFWNFGDDNTSTLENPTHTYTTPGVYEISLNASNEDCGVASSQTVSVIITDIVEPALDQIQLFPNPAREQVQVWDAQGSQLEIWNSKGQFLWRLEFRQDREIISLTEMARGVYFLRFERAGSYYWERLVVL